MLWTACPWTRRTLGSSVSSRAATTIEAAVTFNGVDTLTGLDLSGRGSEIDAALGLMGPASLVVAVAGKNASLHISDLSVAPR